MVDVGSVLETVQERDKWRRRMEALGRSLEEIRLRRKRLEARLHKVKQELARLRNTREAMGSMNPASVPVEVRRGSTVFTYSGR
jgi:septal ring factor EnvC (AmiA/AmiB activator)